MSAVTRPRTSNVAPVHFYRCPIHDRLVSTDGDGRLLGRCSGCTADAARAFKALRRYPRRRFVFWGRTQ